MVKIIDKRNTGKTERLVALASKDENAIVVCKNPERMKEKMHSWGYSGITTISYFDFISTGGKSGKKYYVDDVENLLKYIVSGDGSIEIGGFTMCIDGE